MELPAKRAAALVATIVACFVLSGQSRNDDAADLARLVDALHVRAGSVVAEIGAGRGQLTVAMAARVGPAGRVYSNDIDEARLRDIRAAVEKKGLQNVTVLEGHATRTNLPESCCDAIFMRDVYHHFGDPAAMNASLLQSLKPGGMLAIIDFPPRDNGESADPGERATRRRHGVTPRTLASELEAAGFEEVTVKDEDGPTFMVVALRPSP